MRIGVCPGSFDPVTNGHIDIFERASKLVDKLVVLIAENPNKNYLFTLEERANLIRQSVAHIPNIEVDFGEGLLNDYVKSRDGHIIIRGLRALSDFETVFIMTNNKYSFVSSTGIRELAKFGGKLEGLVPPAVKEALESKFNI